VTSVAARDELVRSVRASAYRIPTDAPESDGTLSWDATTVVVVRVAAAGEEGVGYTYGHDCLVGLVESLLADEVTGHDPLDVQAAQTRMVRAVRNLGGTGLASLAISAVDVALWDLKARLLGVPLVELMGAQHRSVPVYGSGGFTSYDDRQLTDQLAGWVDSGIPRVKIKVGRDPTADRHRLMVARRAIGPHAELFVDANGAFEVAAALDWARVYRDEFAVVWFEEPVSSDDVDGMCEVRAGAPGGLDIAAGEYAWNPWAARRLLAARAVDCLQLDVTRCLGITGFLAAAAVAEAAQVDVSGHCAPQLTAQVGAAVRRMRHLEYFHDHVRAERMLFDGVLAPVHGSLVPDRGRAGHGLALIEQRAEGYRVA